MKIDKKLIKELVEYLKEFGLTELEYQEGQTKIKVSKASKAIEQTKINKITILQTTLDLTICANLMLHTKSLHLQYTVHFAFGKFAYAYCLLPIFRGLPTALCSDSVMPRQRYAPTALCSDSVMLRQRYAQRYAFPALCLAGVMPCRRYAILCA